MNEGAVALKVNAEVEGFKAAAGPSGLPSVILRNSHGVPNRLPRLASLECSRSWRFQFSAWQSLTRGYLKLRVISFAEVPSVSSAGLSRWVLDGGQNHKVTMDSGEPTPAYQLVIGNDHPPEGGLTHGTAQSTSEGVPTKVKGRVGRRNPTARIHGPRGKTASVDLRCAYFTFLGRPNTRRA